MPRRKTATTGALNEAGRTDYILQELVRGGRVAVERLSKHLGVDATTIRRDLEKLEQQNLLRRVHGGAMPRNDVSFTPQPRSRF